ncbi:MAG TPA: glycoside hydrolase family 31 protein [Spirochaetia bacterium]|nr:glycoside hydrolase family 31 protein [Spirochaetia bacterium]
MQEKVLKGRDYLERRSHGEYLRIEAWSPNCIRVRCSLEPDLRPFDWTISAKDENLDAKVVETEKEITLQNGRLSVVLPKDGLSLFQSAEAPLRFFDSLSGRTLLQERQSTAVFPDPGHRVKAVGASSFRAEARFLADPDEKFYGMGHNQYSFLNLKGCTMELRQMNTHTVVPVYYSSKGYGFFWNNPAYGRATFANNGTYWTAEETDQLDYFVFSGADPAEVATSYARLTGFPSMMPDWAMGFWQCKLRYRTRDELLAVAREHKRRGLPLSVIVIDFFHWAMMGEWDFDPECWPEPESMLQELKAMGIETMVSIWPTVNADSTHFQEMLERGYLVRAENSLPVFMRFTDTYDGVEYLHFVDFTNPDARRYVWDIAKKNYFDRGVRLFWLDECEPEVNPYDTQNMRYYLGNGGKVSSLYPLYEERAFFEGMKAAGEELPINLCRSAWAGSQKYGACVWSGDIYSTFEVLRAQIKNGLNMAMAGIPWWTTDIGGFFGGNTEDPEFRELIVRWFQWGVFCPVFRLHGFRNSWDPKKGGDNEVWSFGDEAYEIIKELLFLRERLTPYIRQHMNRAHETGVPPMRPLFFDYPEDRAAYDVDDEFLFGTDILVAPVTEYGTRKRSLYLPTGVRWKDAYSGESYDGGSTIEVDAPLDHIPVFVRAGVNLPFSG